MALSELGEIPRGLPDLHLPYIAVDLLPAIVGSAFLLAALGSIDSLLTSLVADNLTRTQHDSDRELIGQGVGNCVAGLIGGLPGAGATMRTLVNIRLGGRTRISGMLHSVLLTILMLGAAPLGEAIPLAVLAGILLKTGFDIIDWSFLRRLHRVPVFASALMLVVLVVTVTVDLITAVAIGVFVANLETLYRLSEMQLKNLVVGASSEELHDLSAQEEALLKQAEGKILVYQLDGFMSYGLSRGIARHFSQFSDHQVLIIDFSAVSHVDLSAALTLTEMVEDSKIRHRDVMLSGMSVAVLQSLKATDIDQLIPLEDRFTDRALAIEAAIDRLPGMPSIQSGFGSAV